MTTKSKGSPSESRDDQKFRFSIDRGGTFTDVYAEVPGGGVRTIKLLSEDPQNYDDAPREGIRRIMTPLSGGSDGDLQVNEDRIEWIRMGTTVATNALLERKGERHALIVTRGFKDILRIGDQTRPELFDLVIRKPEQVYETVLEVDERVRPVRDVESTQDDQVVATRNEDRFMVLSRPDPYAIRKDLTDIYKSGIRALAVVFIHAYSFPDHELMVGEIAREIGFTQISLSHQVIPMVKLVPRGDTTAVDAYLTPRIRRYLDDFRGGFKNGLRNTSLLFMRSDGGLVNADQFKGSNAILSGPAGGVVGYAMTAYSEHANKPVIGFDMGGTSTDVSRYGGEYELSHESRIAGVRVQSPQMNIVTVAAGGGSRLFFRHGLFEVGPESAGAHPGPVCYRKNGHLSITDANLALGRLQPDFFPKIFGSTEDQPLDVESAKKALERMTEDINRSTVSVTGKRYSMEEVAYGFIRVANETMIRPIREISVMRGYDVEEHILACFGGAGGQHACAIARELGIRRVFIQKQAGILSAYGMGLADIVVEEQEPSTYKMESVDYEKLTARFAKLEQSARSQLNKQGFSSEKAETIRFLNLRYQGTDTAFMISEPENRDYIQAFRRRHLREFGFDLKDRAIIIDDFRVRAIFRSPGYQHDTRKIKDQIGKPVTAVNCYFDGERQTTDVYKLENLGAGQQIPGPAMLIQDTSTILVEPDCEATITETGDITIDIVAEKETGEDRTTDPVRLSIFSHLFMSIAEQMGRALQKTAISTNIKERLDFSCAIFDEQGNLVANAPHIPVHLGAMEDAVRWQINHLGDDLREGDVIATNHPVAGGSHLPDITVITPIWIDHKPVLYVASRGHHADIGGISPGSMPPFSKTLAEEGACFKSFRLVSNDIFDEEGIVTILKAPGNLKQDDGLEIRGSRRISDNLSDLKAQVAANQQGVDLLKNMIRRYSLSTVHNYMSHIQINAEKAVTAMLKSFAELNDLAASGSVSAEDYLDDGSIIKLKITIDRNTGYSVFDFTGTSPQLSGNLNTPPAVVKSAVLYALRCILNQNIPLNHGCLKPITIITEKGSLLSPSDSAAVVGGNVLTSQRITDVVFKAFQTVAASQGCMNNLTFGNDQFGYYETIGGGAGAGPGWHGQSGVHTHMTNTRITDPEILERRYPVFLRRFEMRSESGGEGRFVGGDGLIRELAFLDRLTVTLLTERRSYQPYGLKGGKPGEKGENWHMRSNGELIKLGGKSSVTVSPGDRIIIKTPGGGGFGKN